MEQEQIVYVLIDPKNELPEEMLWVHVITRHTSDTDTDKSQTVTATYYNHDGIDWLIDDSFVDTYVTHWLKPVQLSTLIEENKNDNWININDRKPSYMDVVLTVNELGIVDSGQYTGEHNEFIQSLTLYNATHWQPLPSAPKP